MLEHIHSPQDLKDLSKKELPPLAEEIRNTLINTVSNNGGHLASNLGMVEATLVLHRLFHSPDDKFFFDVGHQSYVHKLLTGRYEQFSTLRQYGGISGFQNKEESEHDPFTQGHCGTSLSAALGVAIANKLQGKPDYAVAVVGDGALTNGMIYEALNNCSERDLRLIIVINDNNMSISGNIGGLHNYFTHIRTGRSYFRIKHGMDKTLSKIPLLGRPLKALFRGGKNLCKRLFVRNTLFEDLGIDYLGPVDGHNIKKLTTVLQEAKEHRKCCIVHIVTQKGKGYALAEQEPERYHGVGTFNPEEGVLQAQNTCFSEEAGKLLCEQAQSDEGVCAITAAMCDGVGLNAFKEQYPSRFFDVGIAEEHAVTFAAGLSKGGFKPVLMLYSTFAQRSYDQFWQDICIQNLSLTVMLDRCGVVPQDGVTHQGVFDYSIFSTLPNVKIYSPATYVELRECFHRALSEGGLKFVRYAKGQEISPLGFVDEELLSYTEGIQEQERIILTYGRLSGVAKEARELLNGNVGVVKLLQIYPLPYERIFALLKNAKFVYVLEEGYRVGGVGEKLSSEITLLGKKIQVEIHAVESWVQHGSVNELFAELGFTPQAVAERILEKCKENVKKEL